ncbi:hypothetical protein PRNP1_004760 [Phytophthora ramorum]
MPRGSRPRVKGFEASPSQCLRTAISYQRKYIINSFVEQNGMAAAVTRFYPSLQVEARKRKKRQLHQWFEARDDIAKQVAQGNGHLCREPRSGVGCILPRAEEDYLAFWIRDLRREGVPVSPLMLQMKARTVAGELGLRFDQFSASSSWRLRFLKSYRLSLRRRTRIGQKTPSDLREVAEKFHEEVQRMMLKNGITEVYNADQTALNFEHLPTHTIDETGTRTVWVRNSGKEKSRLTAMVLADSRGIKRAPFLVFKQPPSRVPATEQHNHKEQQGFGRDLWKKVKAMQASTGMPIYCNSRGWWNAELSVLFLRFHFAARTDIDEPVLLIWDEFSGHWTSEVEVCAKELNVLLLKVPGGYTSVCQPADIAWMRPLKVQLRAEWLSDIEKQFERHQGKQSRKFGVPSDQRKVPLDDAGAYDAKLQVVIQLLESCKIGEDVSKDAERDNSDKMRNYNC